MQKACSEVKHGRKHVWYFSYSSLSFQLAHAHCVIDAGTPWRWSQALQLQLALSQTQDRTPEHPNWIQTALEETLPTLEEELTSEPVVRTRRRVL